MEKYKQNEFTVEEVIKLLEGQVVVQGDGTPAPAFEKYNEGVIGCVNYFKEFKIGNIALEVETGTTVYTGSLTASMIEAENEASD